MMSAQETDKTRSTGDIAMKLFFGNWVRKKVKADIFIAKATDKEFAVHDGLKEERILWGDGMQRTKRAVVFRDAGGDLIEELMGGLFVADDGEGIEVTGISGEGNIHATKDVGDTFAHGDPGFLNGAATNDAAVDFKVFRVVNGGLDPQHVLLLVVHFDRVFGNPVFDAQTFGSASGIA